MLKSIKQLVKSNEGIFLLYFWGFIVLKPILQLYSTYSTLILASYIIILMGYFLLINYKTKFIKKEFFIIVIFLVVFIFDLLFRKNEYTTIYIRDFIIYGMWSIILFSNIHNYKKLLEINAIIASIIFIFYCYDPFIGYKITGNYMGFGFNMVLPCCLSVYVGYKIVKFKPFIIIFILSAIEALIFANRSVLLSILAIVLVVEIANFKKNIRKYIVMISLIIIFILVVNIVNFKNIVNNLYLYLYNHSIDSYSIRAIYSYMNNKSMESLFSGRLEIWDKANTLLTNNYIFGLGTGIFQSVYKTYTHNIIYDFLLQYGILGLLFFAMAVYKALKNIIRGSYYYKITGILMLCLWFPKLLFSIYFFEEISIWCFLCFCFIKKEYNKKLMRGIVYENID